MFPGDPAPSGAGGNTKCTQAVFLLGILSREGDDYEPDQAEADAIMARVGGSVTNEFSRQLYFSADANALELVAGFGLLARFMDETPDFDDAINKAASELASSYGALESFCRFLSHTPCLDGEAASERVDDLDLDWDRADGSVLLKCCSTALRSPQPESAGWGRRPWRRPGVFAGY